MDLKFKKKKTFKSILSSLSFVMDAELIVQLCLKSTVVYFPSFWSVVIFFFKYFFLAAFAVMFAAALWIDFC